MNSHGGYFAADMAGYLDFSANIAPFGMPEKIKEAAKASAELAEQYPDPYCAKLREAIAEKYTAAYEPVFDRRDSGFAEGSDHLSKKDFSFFPNKNSSIFRIFAENVICGNGAADLIYRTAGALRGKCKKALIIEPAFTEYERALKLNGIEIEHFLPERESLSGCLEKIKDPDIGLLFMANPSNPKGVLVCRDELESLSEACAENGAVLVIDECFIEFIEDYRDYSMLSYLNDPNLSSHILILNAFTKLYAMPGLRLGYMIGGNTGLLRRIDEERQPWIISTPAYEAGLAALELSDEEYRLPLVNRISTQRKLLKEELERLGFTDVTGRANYLFFKSEIKDLRERLLLKKILIRDCSDYYGLDKGCYRIAVLKKEDNKRLIKGLKALCCS